MSRRSREDTIVLKEPLSEPCVHSGQRGGDFLCAGAREEISSKSCTRPARRAGEDESSLPDSEPENRLRNDVTKDVMILDIQQYRILTFLSSAFFTCVCADPRENKKCDASVRKLDFLRPWGAEIRVIAHGIRGCKLLFRTEPWAGREAEG